MFSELPNHHKPFSKISNFTLFILIYSTLLYGCCVFYIMYVCDKTYVCIYTHWRHKAGKVMSLCNKSFTHTGKLGTDGIAAITINNYVINKHSKLILCIDCDIYRVLFGPVISEYKWQIHFYTQIIQTKRQDAGMSFTRKRLETLTFCRYIHIVCINVYVYIDTQW